MCIRDNYQTIVKNDQLLWTTVAMALFMIGYVTTTSFGLYYFEFIFGDKDMYSVFAAVLGVSQISALAVFPLFSKRFTRKQLYLAATILVVAGYLIFYPATTSMLQIGIAGVLLFIGQAFIQLIMLMFISDCVEYGQYKLCLLYTSTLHGLWGKEAHVSVAPLTVGTFSSGAETGTSSNQHNPGLMLLAGDESGYAYGLNIIYSGNHYTRCV